LVVPDLVNDGSIPKIFLCLSNAYPDPPIPSVADEKMKCSNYDVVTDMMNMENVEEVSRFFVEAATEDHAATDTVKNVDLDHRDEATT
ncbi:hypothetical protein KI387_016880, partial [Taxus chinensis]